MKKIKGEYIVAVISLMTGAFVSGCINGYFSFNGFIEWLVRSIIELSFLFLSLFLYKLIKVRRSK